MKPPPSCSELQDGGGFLCLGCAWLVQFCVGFRIGGRMRSQGLLATVEASPEPVGGGSAPSAALSASKTEPPPRVPGMRLVQY